MRLLRLKESFHFRLGTSENAVIIFIIIFCFNENSLIDSQILYIIVEKYDSKSELYKIVKIFIINMSIVWKCEGRHL
jgi:hypothetical protein